MFLDLGLQVGGILEGLLGGGGELLVNPRLQFVGIALEILEAPRIFQLLTSEEEGEAEGGGYEKQEQGGLENVREMD